jgi:hypothetical protein
MSWIPTEGRDAMSEFMWGFMAGTIVTAIAGVVLAAWAAGEAGPR